MTDIIEIIEAGPQGLPGEPGLDGIDGIDGTDGLDAVPVAGDWVVHQNITLAADTTTINFDIPVGVKFIRLEGMLAVAVAALVTDFRMTVNNDNSLAYSYEVHHNTSTGTDISTAHLVDAIKFSSSWSGGEKALMNLQIECKPPVNPDIARAVQCHTSNTGGDGDNHTTGGWFKIPANITSLQIYTIPFFTIPAQPMGEGTDLTLYIKY